MLLTSQLRPLQFWHPILTQGVNLELWFDGFPETFLHSCYIPKRS